MAFTQTPLTRDAYLALLDWYVESGVDIALDEAPHDRYAAFAAPPAPVEIERREPPLAPQAPATSPRARPLAPAIAAPDDAARAAQEAAAGAGDLADLAVRLAEFPHAPFRDMAQHFLLSTGAAGARLMAFDASPGATEESTGEAFSGLHAKLLDNMLAAIGHDRTNAYLAYVAPWRPPGDRPLTPQEAAIFAPFARRHVELARPDVLLLFGEAPARVMLTTNETLAKMRGKPFDVRGGAHSARAFVFSSLDSMLKSPAMKPAAWRDLRAAAEALQP